MGRQKHLSPQEIYRARKQLEEEEKRAYLPPGLINHGNTCFMNSVLQGLMATPLLSDLAQFTLLPEQRLFVTNAPPISSRRSPQLTNEHGLGGEYQQKWVPGMPIGDVFVSVMQRAWDIQRTRRRESISPRDLLTVLGRKYDQYLDFGQQDAHEFLRQLLDAMRMEEFDIIKARRPPERPKKHHRRHTIQAAPALKPSSDLDDASSTTMVSTPPLAADRDNELIPFVDMIFGGKLTSILVCEKCKHISQTQEDFNDLSLSIKPEDYTKERKRDLFKTIAKRFASFPSTSTGVAMQRSSSVPPSPRDVNQLPDLPIEDGPRRRSLDITGDAALDDVVIIDKNEVEGSNLPEAAGSPPAVPEASQPVIEEGKQVGFAELPKVERKEKKEKDDASWSKLGRKISMSIRLGKEKERSGRSKEAVQKDTSVTKPKDGGEHAVPQGGAFASTPTSSANSSDAGHYFDSSPEIRTQEEIRRSSSPFFAERPKLRPRDRSSRPKSISVLPITASAVPSTTATRTPQAIPPIQRMSSKRVKSPQPPKPTAEETAYLRQILADITPSSSNPFALFKNAGQYAKHGVPSSSPSSAHAMWLKMGQLPGIEECLRMFTAVEILDGENMVGCRRCWKIANGMYPTMPPSDGESSGSDSETEENGKGDKDDVQGGPYNVQKLPTLYIDTLPTSPKPLSTLSASMSSPIISLYAHANHSDNVSVSSLPSLNTSAAGPPSESRAYPPPLNLRDDPGSSGIWTASNGSPTPAGSTASLEISPAPFTARPFVYPKDAGTRDSYQATYGGIVIPSISTTAPESPTSPLTARPRLPPDAAQSHLAPGETLRTPRVFHRRPKESDFYDNSCESSETESDASTSTSAFYHSGSSSPTLASPELSPAQSQHSKESSGASPRRILRSEQVIMRAAYKRYLIGTPPPVLVIHLKRFQQISKTHQLISFSNGFKKLDDYVTFHEYLDLTPFLAPKREDFGLGKARKRHKLTRAKDKERCMYRLYAVVVHIGNMLGGHYIAYTALPTPPPVNVPDGSSAATPITNNKTPRQWAYISDTVVRLVSLEEVLKAKAYICMYERI